MSPDVPRHVRAEERDAPTLLTVTDSAQTLVLYAHGEEVERLPPALARGGVNEIRPWRRPARTPLG